MHKQQTSSTFVTLNQSAAPNVKGRVEKIQQKHIVGWAQNLDSKNEPVMIDVYVGDDLLETIIADKQTDVLGVQYDYGQCGFAYSVPESFLSGKQTLLSFVEHQSKRPITGSPFKTGAGLFDTRFAVENGALVSGFVQQRTVEAVPFSIKLLVDKVEFWSENFIGGQPVEFNVKLPDDVFDSAAHKIHIKITNDQDKTLLSTMRKVQHQYKGMVESVNFDRVIGWIANQAYPELAVALDVYLNNRRIDTVSCDLTRKDVQRSMQFSSDKLGFNCDLARVTASETTANIELFIKGTRNRVLNKKYVLTPKDIIVRSLMTAAQQLNHVSQQGLGGGFSAGLAVDDNAGTWVNHQIIAPLLKQLRQKSGLPKQVNLNLSSVCQLPSFDLDDTVDIIIPVYKGYEETVNCIQSVLDANNLTSCQIIVINDQSPDGRLTYKLQAWSQEAGFTLIENAENKGFVGSVNIGMKLHKNRHVVLLNSDTLVFDGWLDRMIETAEQDQKIGTVTPFSNNATICSFPQFNLDNELPENVSSEQLDKLFAGLNTGQSIDVPTAVGFCMLIKRQALETVGYFDEKTWQKGYGEENDFCLRASALGWRHVLATDVFVHHFGSVSFSEAKNQYLETNLAILNKRYPDYPQTVQRFIQQDPVAQYRNPVIKQLMKQQSDRYLLFVMHDLGGGAKTHVQDLADLLIQQNQYVLELVANSKGQWQLRDMKQGWCIKYQFPDDKTLIEQDLKALGVWHIHFHQLIGFDEWVWQLPELLSCQYDFTAHDFLPMCPRINMIDESGYFCDQSRLDAEKCQRCVELNGLPDTPGLHTHWMQYDQSVGQWRDGFQNYLAGAEHVFCPSTSTQQFFKQHFNLKNLQLRVHPEPSFVIQPDFSQQKEERANVAIIGAIGEHKGSHLLLQCAKQALKEGLPLQFVLIGFSNIDQELKALNNVTLTGKYQSQDELTRYINEHCCQLALFLSVWPETFCYTLTEALQNQLFPVALDYGAIAERIEQLQFGLTIPAKSRPDEINAHLLSAMKHIKRLKKQRNYSGAEYKDVLTEYYAMKSHV